MSGIKKRRINEEESKMARNGKNGEGDPIGNGTVMDGENNPVGMVKENNLYNNNDEGPYRVMVELQDNKEGEIRINKLSLAQTLQKMIVYKGHITEVKQAGRQKVMVYLNNYQLANRLTTDKDFNQRNYRAYIPKHLVAGIPLDMKDEDVTNGIISEVPVLGVKRLTRFIDGRREPTQRVSVTFRAKKIPSLVKSSSRKLPEQDAMQELLGNSRRSSGKRTVPECEEVLALPHKSQDGGHRMP
nr:uncharacterized protein LOC115259436 [Aedes albopictus]